MLTGYASIEHAVAAIKAGAIDYITKPVRPEQLELAVDQALEVVRLRRENERAAPRGDGVPQRARRSSATAPPIRRLLQTVATAAPTRATVLLAGRVGHRQGAVRARDPRRRATGATGPFIKLNCAALPEGLVESALFGHEKGAFTGAIKRVEGAFERAHGGTLLLDEISEMRLDLQAKLLRVLQEQEFERVGGIAADQGRRAHHRDDEPRPRGRRGAGALPPGPLLPAERDPDLAPAAARAAGGHPAAGATASPCASAHEIGKEIRGIAPEAVDDAAALRVAGQRARAAARRGARGDPHARPDAAAARVRRAAVRPHARAATGPVSRTDADRR